MTKSEKIVAIAKDVIKQIHNDKLKYIGGGGYFTTKDLVLPLDDDAQCHIDKIQSKSCGVCALGAAFISYIRLYDNVKIRDIARSCNLIESDYLRPSPDVLFKHLVKIFSRSQLNLIEAAFEKRWIGGTRALDYYGNEINTPSYAYRAKAINFTTGTPKERLLAIMRNIIKNKGVFKP